LPSTARSTARAAAQVAKQFAEVVIAPSITREAREVFAAKRNVRLLEVPLGTGMNQLDFKRIGGGMLLQSQDTKNVGGSELRVVTKLAPTRRRWTTCCSHGRSPSSSRATPLSFVLAA
jgi:phosphoribosylaminoimidazolecarboxamide formyltransferase/IMP cyclohydrolase